jgi:hypothetical protein
VLNTNQSINQSINPFYIIKHFNGMGLKLIKKKKKILNKEIPPACGILTPLGLFFSKWVYGIR